LLQRPRAIDVWERNPYVGESFLLRTVATNFSMTVLCERASWLAQDRRLPRRADWPPSRQLLVWFSAGFGGKTNFSRQALGGTADVNRDTVQR
jgi:hypothetical protein